MAEKLLGSAAPDFRLQDQSGAFVALDDFAGTWLILYFYPKDGTPLCTQEACNFRDDYSELAGQTDLAIAGISQDDIASHQAFAEAHDIPFSLLSDTDLAVTKAYECYQPQNAPDREYLGIIRSTFLIDPNGKIAKIYRFVEPNGHSKQLLEDLNSLR